jgi:hypothetical protein
MNNRVRDKAEKEQSNVQIRIEGKDPINDSMDKKSPVNINVKDIERIVFQKRSRDELPMKPYVEEDSYLNPSFDQIDDEYDNQRLISFVHTGHLRGDSQKSFSLEDDYGGTIKLNGNDIYINGEQPKTNRMVLD